MRQVLVMHGIGDHSPDFHLAWEQTLRSSIPDIPFEVVPIYWGDLQQRIAARYPLVSPRLATVLAKVGVGAGEDFRTSDAYTVIHDYVMDVVAYSLLHEMRHFIQTECLLALKQKTHDREGETILLGHSLGAAVLTHIVQLERRVTGATPYRGLVLLAPPLGIKSPIDGIPDPLAVTPDSTLPTSIAGDLDAALLGERFDWAQARADGELPTSPADRLAVLQQVCFDWSNVDANALHFCINKFDIVCSDVRFPIGGRLLDPIQIKQGYDAGEREVIEQLANLHELEFGAADLDSIASNHDAQGYLRQPAVVDSIRSLLAEGVR